MRLTIKAKLGLTWRQCDIHSAFLQGKLTEDIFMQFPQGFAELFGIPAEEGKCLKLVKVLESMNEVSKHQV